MARPINPEKRRAILRAAAEEIAVAGLGATTANIALRAGVATGTLFTYFPDKDALLNELYLSLKVDVYAHISLGFPHGASLETRTRHIWNSYLEWALQFPAKRRASVQLHVSDVITAASRAEAAAGRGDVDATLAELGSRSGLRNLPAGFATASMAAMQEAALDFVAKFPRRKKSILDESFRLYWKAVR